MENRRPSLLRMASVACGVQFGWALQFSLLTPYAQELGIPHALAGLIWLCGPITGMVIIPLAGHMSDRCCSCWGRRRPFIVAGACLIICAVLIIGFSADLGFLLGDTASSRPRAITIFAVGFWILDVGNNALQAPSRGLLADFTENDPDGTRVGHAFYSMFMAVGNVLGCASGSYSRWFIVFPFSRTAACDVSCSNLKSAFAIHIVVLLCTLFCTVISANEIPLKNIENVSSGTPLLGQNPCSSRSHRKELRWWSGYSSGDQAGESFIWELRASFRDLSKPMWLVLCVNAIGWSAWCSFYLFGTDWMGSEMYRGQPSDVQTGSGELYNMGVTVGAFGLFLNAVVLGLTSLVVEFLWKRWGLCIAWGVGNIILFLGYIAMLAISLAAKHMAYSDSGDPPNGVVVGALLVFAILGAPMAVTLSAPYSLTSTITRTTGAGQGMSMGVLSLSIVIPQLIVSLSSGPWDEVFGGGDSPTFCVAAMAALVSGIIAIIVLPKYVFVK